MRYIVRHNMGRIEATLSETILLGSYLHDSSFTVRDALWDPHDLRFRVALEREGYEFAQRGRLLAVLPVTRYLSVPSVLTVTDVSACTWQWTDDAFSGPDDVHTLMSLEAQETSLVIATEYADIELAVGPATRLLLEDVGPPSVQLNSTDFGGPSFTGLEELKRLRSSG